MFRIVYLSTANTPLSKAELTGMLEQSRSNNQQRNITGMLLYKGGNFMQVLEGPDDAVTTLFARIATDRRHKDVQVISREQIQTRQFPAWEMAFQDLDSDAIKNEPGFSQFLHDEFTAEIYQKNPLRAYIMLLTFRDNLR